MKKILILSIIFYQKYLSFDTGLPKKLGFSKGFVCMYYPTCSEYTKQSITKYGALVGLKLGYKRVLRCRPGNEPSVDLVP